jgi:hypothetical protein
MRLERPNRCAEPSRLEKKTSRIGIVKATGTSGSGASLSPLNLISEIEREGGPATSQTRSQH